jgi:ketosteroid isomerase-like protein
VAEVSFVQRYESGTVKDRSTKKMNVVQTPDGWRIVSEESQPMPKPVPAPVAAAAPMMPVAPAAAPVAVETPAVAVVAAAPVDPVQAVSTLVEQWAQAWSSKDFAAYGGFYGEQFKTGPFKSKKSWLNHRKPRILGRSAIEVAVEDVKVNVLESGVAEVSFVQRYESGTVKDRSTKKMNVVQTPDGWRIVSEESLPIPKSVQAPDAAPVPVTVVADPQLAEDQTAVVSEVLLKWATAWSSKDFDTYANFYGEQFKTGPYRSKAAWLSFRQPRIMSNDDIQVTVDSVVAKVRPAGQLEVTFVQRYTSKALKIRSVKKMILAKTGDEWKIVSERD